MYDLYLETQRLLIREHTSNDLFNINKLMSNPITMHYLDRIHNGIEDSKEYLERLLEKQYHNPRRSFKMAIELNSNNNYIGMIDLEVETDNLIDGRADLSYYIMPEYWGNGFASEAARKIIRFGFSVINLHKITAGCLKTNVSSENVMVSCGMIKEAEFRKHAMRDGEWTNRVEYGILKEDADL